MIRLCAAFRDEPRAPRFCADRALGVGWLVVRSAGLDSLERCGNRTDWRRQRLLGVLQQATGLDVSEGWMKHPTAWFEYPKPVDGLHRAVLEDRGDALELRVWLAELTPQARCLYGDPRRVERLAALGGEDEWDLHPNPHVAFWQSSERQRWYTRCRLSADVYMQQWIDDLARAGRTISRDDLADGTLLDWLIARGYAQRNDQDGLECLIKAEPTRKKFDMRPSIRVSRRWTWREACELDGEDHFSRLAPQVREALGRVLAILDQPALPRTL
jgi:hypothetical protein